MAIDTVTPDGVEIGVEAPAVGNLRQAIDVRHRFQPAIDIFQCAGAFGDHLFELQPV